MSVAGVSRASALTGRVLADLVKYGLASAAALALDVAVLMLLHRVLGVVPAIAAALGFLSGLALIYVLSVACVFPGRRRRPARAEIACFLVTGLAGLALTEALMTLFVEGAGISVPLSKIPTSGLVFLFNFTARRALLFSGARRE
ncbi:GtrA family protein [Methylocystis sp. IM3]|uniref:GtrA family protein n=1 Tax=unclassified Methylocystis TaxID=2625913 RepID=UPI0030FB9804